MAWDFETDPEFQRRLDWADAFMKDEVEPLDFVKASPFDKTNVPMMKVLRPLQERVKEQGLWACHLEPELGGQGHGQVKLALLNEIVGRSRWAPSIFGSQAPDSGNAEILAQFGTPSQKERYLRPLLDGEISSGYSMSEPQGGADPTTFVTRAVRDGDEWVIDGEKWFTSNARYAAFFIVMAVTNPDISPYKGMSLFVVPAETPGIEIIRNLGVGGESEQHASHAYMRFNAVRVPHDCLLGEEGSAFAIAQVRLGGGRVHHAMRTIATARRALDMMLERAVSREVRGGSLAALQLVQQDIADSWIQLEQYRLLVLRTAWLIDKHRDYRKVRMDIAACKVVAPKVLHDIVQKSMHLHGALGVSNEMPFAKMLVSAESLAIGDGPTEVHKMTVARQLLRSVTPVQGLWPTMHTPTRKAASRQKYGDLMDALGEADADE